MTSDTVKPAWLAREGPLPFDDETERLAALRRLRLLDSPQSESFDRVTRLVAIALRVPIALVSLVDESRQWFKSRYGLDEKETAREISFCAYAIANRESLVVPDATKDPRFATNPLVANDPKIRFYAGVPIFTRDGHAVGTLCAIDRKPRDLNYEAAEILHDFASIVQDLVQAQDVALRMSGFAFASERERLLDESIEALPVGVMFTSIAGKIRRTNDRACELLGMDPGEPLRKNIAEIMHPKDWDAHWHSIHAVATGALKEGRIRARLQRKSGGYFNSLISVSLKRLHSGCPAYVLLIVESASER